MAALASDWSQSVHSRIWLFTKEREKNFKVYWRSRMLAWEGEWQAKIFIGD